MGFDEVAADLGAIAALFQAGIRQGGTHKPMVGGGGSHGGAVEVVELKVVGSGYRQRDGGVAAHSTRAH